MINKAPITITDISLIKEYDGTTNVNVISNSSSGIISSDNVAIQGSATNFSDKIVGNNYSSTVTFNLITNPSTGKENNYFIIGGNQFTITDGTITKRPITITASANAKLYDGTISATATPTLTGTLASGDVGTYSETYDTKSQGTNKILTPTATILDASNASMTGNYSITYASVNTGVITKLPITITASANAKVYDGTISATATPTLTGTLASGDVGTYSETYDTKSQGTNKVLTPTVVSILDATNASMTGNYSITYGTNTNGVITKLPITLTATANTKVYDGTLSATATPTLTGTLASGDVGTYSETYDTKTQGINKVLTPSVISILDATNASMTGNYSITYGTNTNGVITKLPITITASTNTKVYDGTISATATPTLTGTLASGDVGTYSETYDTKTQGINKTITPTATILDATNASMTGNYSITYANINTGVITKLPITLTATANTKVYDGTISATATPTLTGTLASGDVGVYSETYDTKSQGTNKTLIPTATILDATNASMTGNYSITYTNINTGVITELPITVTANASDKAYDGNKTASVVLGSNKLGSDVVTLTKTLAEFDTKYVGTGKTVNVSGITISGVDAGNYTLTSATAIGTASITAVGLNVTANASDKAYDGNKTAIVNLSSNKLVADVVSITKTLAEFDTKNVGMGKTVNVIGIAIAGADAGNYTLTSSTATGTASITAKLLTIKAKPHIITYNGTSYAGGNGVVPTGLISGETISNLTGTLTYAGTSQGAKNVGSYTIIPGGLSSPNYNINYVGDNLEINKATLNVTAGNQSVEYGTQLAKILSDAHSTYSGFVGGDDATVVSGTPTYLTNYTSSIPAGTNGIFLEPKITGLTSANYDFVAVNGTITINAAPNSYFQIPNAFVPGSLNEFDKTFRVFSNSGFPSNLFVSLSIYNRSGQFIKKLESITDSWDGRIGGVLQEADVYLWTATFIDDPLTKNIPRSGTFILLK